MSFAQCRNFFVIDKFKFLAHSLNMEELCFSLFNPCVKIIGTIGHASQLKPLTSHGCFYTSLLICVLLFPVILYHTTHVLS